MLKHRCPWCGEMLPFRSPIVQIVWKMVDPDVCPSCKKPYTSHASRNSSIALCITFIVICIVILILRLDVSPTWYWIVGILGIILLISMFLQLCRIPYARKVNKKEAAIFKEKITSKVVLFWESKENDGLILPRFRVSNGEIYPACFLNADERPISPALCVVLNNIHWSDSQHCTSEIYFVLDDVNVDELFKNGNKLYLYYYRRKIATGTIV